MNPRIGMDHRTSISRSSRHGIFLLKHCDCISEYKHLYQKEHGHVSDGPEPYLEQVISCVEQRTPCRLSVISLGDRDCRFTPRNNIELRVVNNATHRSRLLVVLRFIQNNVVLLAHLARRRPVKIINLGGMRYVPLLLLYSYLSRSDIYLFLAEWVRGDVLLNRLTVKMIERRFAKVFSRSRANVDILCDLGYSKECDLYGPRYAEPPHSQIRPTALRKDKAFKVLFIGRLAGVKGIAMLKEVALRLRAKDIAFYVIGDGPCLESLKQFKHRNRLGSLNLLGFMPNRMIYSYIKDSDIGFIPSRSEGLAKTALEFMIMETAVVTSNVGGIPEVIRDGVNGFLIEPDDADGACMRIEQLHNDRDLLSRLSSGTRGVKTEILNHTKDFSYYLERILR